MKGKEAGKNYRALWYRAMRELDRIHSLPLDYSGERIIPPKLLDKTRKLLLIWDEDKS